MPLLRTRCIMPLIQLENISRRYQMGAETIHALRDVSLTIERASCRHHGAIRLWQIDADESDRVSRCRPPAAMN
jgi:hypothetical protein